MVSSGNSSVAKLFDELTHGATLRPSLFDELAPREHGTLAAVVTEVKEEFSEMLWRVLDEYLDEGASTQQVLSQDGIAASHTDDAIELEGALWVRDQVLEDNDRLRRQIHRLKFEAMMRWQTVDYPDLDAEDFDELERQPPN